MLDYTKDARRANYAQRPRNEPIGPKLKCNRDPPPKAAIRTSPMQVFIHNPRLNEV